MLLQGPATIEKAFAVGLHLKSWGVRLREHLHEVDKVGVELQLIAALAAELFQYRCDWQGSIFSALTFSLLVVAENS